MIFSIVIPTYNRIDTLKYVLLSLIHQDFEGEYEIIISDSMSEDKTQELIKYLIKTYPDKNLRYFRVYNGTRAKARNKGISIARGKYILFTDADIIATSNLLTQHYNFHKQAKEDIAVVGWEIQVSTLDEIFKNSFSALHPPYRKQLDWLYFLTGNASVKKRKLLEVGGFDEQFTGYGWEDIELGYRLHKSGVKILYNKDAINFHFHPIKLEDKSKIKYKAGISAVKFYNKYKDNEILYKLGLHPLSIKFFSSISENFIKNISKYSFFKEFVLQYYYIHGVLDGFNKKSLNEL